LEGTCEGVEVCVLDRDRPTGSELIGRFVIPLQQALNGVKEWFPLDGGGQILLHFQKRLYNTINKRLDKADHKLHKHFNVAETEHVTHEFRCALLTKHGIIHSGRLWFTPQHLFFYSKTRKVSIAWKDIDKVKKGKSITQSITIHTKTQETLKFCHFRTRTECLLAIKSYLHQTCSTSSAPSSVLQFEKIFIVVIVITRHTHTKLKRFIELHYKIFSYVFCCLYISVSVSVVL
jgi:hypothetical protein